MVRKICFFSYCYKKLKKKKSKHLQFNFYFISFFWFYWHNLANKSSADTLSQTKCSQVKPIIICLVTQPVGQLLCLLRRQQICSHHNTNFFLIFSFLFSFSFSFLHFYRHVIFFFFFFFVAWNERASLFMKIFYSHFQTINTLLKWQ